MIHVLAPGQAMIVQFCKIYMVLYVDSVGMSWSYSLHKTRRAALARCKKLTGQEVGIKKKEEG